MSLYNDYYAARQYDPTMEYYYNTQDMLAPLYWGADMIGNGIRNGAEYVWDNVRPAIGKAAASEWWNDPWRKRW